MMTTVDSCLPVCSHVWTELREDCQINPTAETKSGQHFCVDICHDIIVVTSIIIDVILVILLVLNF